MGKMDLDKLKVKSFITSFSDQDVRTVKGGDGDSSTPPDYCLCASKPREACEADTGNIACTEPPFCFG